MNEFEYEETLKEYRQEGLEEGRQEGLTEGRRQSAASLKKLGVSPAIIAEATGISLEEIEDI